METVELIVYILVAVVVGSLMIGVLVTLDVENTYEGIRSLFGFSEETAYETVTQETLPAEIITFWDSCGLGSQHLTKTLFVETSNEESGGDSEGSSFNKEDLFAYVQQYRLCKSIQSADYDCGVDEDVVFEGLIAPNSITTLACNAQLQQLIVCGDTSPEYCVLEETEDEGLMQKTISGCMIEENTQILCEGSCGSCNVCSNNPLASKYQWVGLQRNWNDWEAPPITLTDIDPENANSGAGANCCNAETECVVYNLLDDNRYNGCVDLGTRTGDVNAERPNEFLCARKPGYAASVYRCTQEHLDEQFIGDTGETDYCCVEDDAGNFVFEECT